MSINGCKGSIKKREFFHVICVPLKFFSSIFSLKKHLESFPDCQTCFLNILVVVNFEPIIRGHKNNDFDWDQV